MKPCIAITAGDPAGIGPEIAAKALRDPRVSRVCKPILLGRPERVRMGAASRRGGMLAIEALVQGLALVRSGRACALVTAPVSKEAFRLADHGFPGHTEWLAERCETPDAAMLMVSGRLRAILMTRHIPLKDVSRRLTLAVIERSARLGYDFVQKHLSPHPNPLPQGATGKKKFLLPDVGEGRSQRPGMRGPQLVLCGLNPHAGDHGIIGKEEQKIFIPALRALKKKGIFVAGPLPSDSVFPQMAEGRYDLALAAYHDQGMIPLKLYAPKRVVNITLGLPFIRTSPGHGTAYDIAGKGKADPGPMIEAILLAAAYSRR